MSTRSLLALVLLFPALPATATEAASEPRPAREHPVVEDAQNVRARLRASFERLRLERELASARAAALMARTERTAVHVAVPTVTVDRTELRFAVSCPPAAPEPGEALPCRVRLRARGELRLAQPTTTPTGAYATPATLD